MGAQILVVDDEQDYCSNIADILGDMGYGIDVAYRGQEAIERAAQRRYDLLLLDYRLPCMTGAELYRRIKENGVSTPAMIVTTFCSQDTIDKAHDAGVAKVIHKPVDFGELIEAIEEHVGRTQT